MIFKNGVYYPMGNPDEGSWAIEDLMGEHARDAMVAEEDHVSPPPPSLAEKHGYWRTRDGRVIEISKMADEHLSNAIDMFMRFGWGDEPKIQELRNERKRRGK